MHVLVIWLFERLSMRHYYIHTVSVRGFFFFFLVITWHAALYESVLSHSAGLKGFLLARVALVSHKMAHIPDLV